MGVSDGVQHILFVMYILVGEWWATAVTYVGSLFGFILPGLPGYLDRTFDSFRMSYDTMRCRQWWCFGLTAIALALPLLALALVFVVLGALIPIVISLVIALWEWIVSTPWNREEEWLGADEDDVDTDDADVDYTLREDLDSKGEAGTDLEAIDASLSAAAAKRQSVFVPNSQNMRVRKRAPHQ